MRTEGERLVSEGVTVGKRRPRDSEVTFTTSLGISGEVGIGIGLERSFTLAPAASRRILRIPPVIYTASPRNPHSTRQDTIRSDEGRERERDNTRIIAVADRQPIRESPKSIPPLRIAIGMSPLSLMSSECSLSFGLAGPPLLARLQLERGAPRLLGTERDTADSRVSPPRTAPSTRESRQRSSVLRRRITLQMVLQTAPGIRNGLRVSIIPPGSDTTASTPPSHGRPLRTRQGPR